MLVMIASLQQPTFHSEFSWSRKPGQTITDYVIQEIDRRVQFVSDRLETAAKTALEQRPESECLFFTLPEFFWNVPWSSVQSEEELLELSTAYIDNMPHALERLMRWADRERFGKIVLLAGTCATLIKVGEGQESYFDVINYLLASSNFKFRSDGLAELSAWPKRYVSDIDFGYNVDRIEGYWFFELSNNVVVKVRDVSSVVAEHRAAESYGPAFINTLIPACTFSINLCLDYAVLENGERNDELENIHSKIDFLIACGMFFDEGQRYPDSVQFAVRNDGMDEGGCEFAEVESGRIIRLLPSTIIEDTLHLAVLEVN